jgi:hypothetical protein
MYEKPFYINSPTWNNAFSYEKRINKQIFVSKLIKIKNVLKIELWEKIVFEDYDFDNKLNSCTWLKNFYEIDYLEKKVYFFDNHNHAFYFWFLARKIWLIRDNNILYHIDEHSDMRDPKNYLQKPNSYDLKEIFYYTNYFLNVWNYITPALKEWIISEVIQIRNSQNLEDYFKNSKEESLSNQIILNLDLDFFQPNLDFIDYELKKKVVLDILKKATVVTVASSPFFIDQKLAIKVFKDLFSFF